MDLHTLIQAQMELMGNDQPVASCGLHGATRRDVIEQAIEYLPKIISQHRTRRAFRIWLSHKCRDLQKREAKILITANPNTRL